MMKTRSITKKKQEQLKKNDAHFNFPKTSVLLNACCCTSSQRVSSQFLWTIDNFSFHIGYKPLNSPAFPLFISPDDSFPMYVILYLPQSICNIYFFLF